MKPAKRSEAMMFFFSPLNFPSIPWIEIFPMATMGSSTSLKVLIPCTLEIEEEHEQAKRREILSGAAAWRSWVSPNKIDKLETCFFPSKRKFAVQISGLIALGLFDNVLKHQHPLVISDI